MNENYIQHSGGAIGADYEWARQGAPFGVVSRHYWHRCRTPYGNVEISKADYDEGVQHVLLANRRLHRHPERHMNLLARNWCQVKYSDAVFAVGHSYQIMVPVNCDTLFWVTVNGRDYYDHSNGIIRSAVRMHRVSVPMQELDTAGAYTVHSRKIIERKPYFTTTEEPESVTYPFHPLPQTGPLRMYHMSDTHGNFENPAGAARILGVETSGYTHSFTDVAGHWVSPELGWPAHVEILKGTGGGRFSPETQLTNEQAIAIVWRAWHVLGAA